MKAAGHPYFDTRFAALAHRGGAKLATNRGRENTLRAFSNAVDLGYRYLETDVHLTSDGHLVAFHDESLDRVTARTGRIADLRLSEVRAAKVGPEHIPTLDEVLDSFDVRLNIDIKAPGAEQPLVHALHRHNAWHRVCVGSFSELRLQRFRMLAGSRAATSVGPAGVAATLAAVRLGGVGVAPIGGAYQVPLTAVVAGRRVQVVTEKFIRLAHRWRKAVYVWTIDDEAMMQRLIDMGVDGLVSDQIDLLKYVLECRGLWPS